MRLLAERPFEAIRVTDVARRAGVSVGGVYRRFRNKRALLHLADLGFIDDCRQAFERALSPRRTAGRPLAWIVATYVTVMITKFREHRVAILQVQRHADPADAALYRARAREFNDHVHGRLRDLIRERSGEIAHAEPEIAMNFAIFFASAAARDAVWRGSLQAYPVAVDDARLIAEITRAFLSYLATPA